jgi:hypothetical protein
MFDGKGTMPSYCLWGIKLGSEAGIKHKIALQKRLRAIFSWNKIKR